MILLLLLYSPNVSEIYKEMWHNSIAPDYRQVRPLIVSHTGDVPSKDAPSKIDVPYHRVSLLDLRDKELRLSEVDTLLFMPENGDPTLAAKVAMLTAHLERPAIIIDRNWQLA